MTDQELDQEIERLKRTVTDKQIEVNILCDKIKKLEEEREKRYKK